MVVLGEAAPAGSKRAFLNKHTGRVNVVDANPAAKPFKALVRAEAAARYGGNPLKGPVEVEMTFYRRRPKGHYGTGRNEGRIKDSAPEFPTTKPDALKLARGVEDALTGIIWADDSQIVSERLLKRYDDLPRTEIIVRPLSNTRIVQPTLEEAA